MIKFPRVHIAESVANRILNLWDDLQDSQAIRDAAAAMPPAIPDVPGNAPTEGMMLSQAIQQPPAQELQTPEGIGPGVVARGEDLVEQLP